MDPFEKYDMIFNGAMLAFHGMQSSTGRYAGEDNGWTAAVFSEALADFEKSIMKYPSIQRFPGGASNDLIPNLQNPKNPLPLLDPNNMTKAAVRGSALGRQSSNGKIHDEGLRSHRHGNPYRDDY
jgi:arylsulfatase